MSSTLPESAEPKLIDIWMCVHVGVLFLVFLVHIMTGFTKNSGGEEREETRATVSEKRKWDMMNSVLELVSYNYKNMGHSLRFRLMSYILPSKHGRPLDGFMTRF